MLCPTVFDAVLVRSPERVGSVLPFTERAPRPLLPGRDIVAFAPTVPALVMSKLWRRRYHQYALNDIWVKLENI
jgi:hypothetical protein